MQSDGVLRSVEQDPELTPRRARTDDDAFLAAQFRTSRLSDNDPTAFYEVVFDNR
jgi:hypothetical protein